MTVHKQLATAFSIRPRSFILTACHVGLIACKTAVYRQKDQTWKTDSGKELDQQSKSVTKVKNSCKKAVNICAVDGVVRHVCTDSDVLLRAPRLDCFHPNSSISTQQETAAQQNQCVVQSESKRCAERVRVYISRSSRKLIDRVLKSKNSFEITVLAWKVLLLGWLSPAAPIDSPFERS